MKNLTRVAILALGVACLSLFVPGQSLAAHESPPTNVGVPMPPLTDLPWEIEHKVRAGEFLYMLAGYYYQDGRKWNWIYETNRDRLEDANHIYPGQILIIRVPRGWSPPMSYRMWYDRMKEQYQNYKGPGGPAGSNEPKAIPPGKETPGT